MLATLLVSDVEEKPAATEKHVVQADRVMAKLERKFPLCVAQAKQLGLLQKQEKQEEATTEQQPDPPFTQQQKRGNMVESQVDLADQFIWAPEDIDMDNVIDDAFGSQEPSDFEDDAPLMKRPCRHFSKKKAAT